MNTLRDALERLNRAAYAAHRAARGTPEAAAILPLLRITDDLVDGLPPSATQKRRTETAE
jgi:hypothetical protein